MCPQEAVAEEAAEGRGGHGGARHAREAGAEAAKQGAREAVSHFASRTAVGSSAFEYCMRMHTGSYDY